MKRIICLVILVLLASQCLFADMIHVGTNNKTPGAVQQEIVGYIDAITRLEIQEPVYGGNGFNLDIMDPTNDLRFLIAPTMVALSSPGAKIGSFSMITNQIGSKLKITHTPLITTVEENGILVNVILDWELGVSWDENGSPQEAMCLSAGWSMGGNVSEVDRSIIIVLVANPAEPEQSVVRIQDARLLFRLSAEYPVKKQGVYVASVIFEVEEP